MKRCDYDLCLIATHVNQLSIGNLIESILVNNNDLRIYFIIISQNSPLKFEGANNLVDIQTVVVANCSLSRARNIGLSLLRESQKVVGHIMFPDDDTSFDSNFFKKFKSVVEHDKSYIMPIFQQGSLDNLYMGFIYREGHIVPQKMKSLIGSPNQIICYLNNKQLIYFNEDLGVGAKFGSCEDLDLFLRLNRNGSHYYYTSIIYNFHPAKVHTFNNLTFSRLISRFKNYSAGFCFIIFKYKFYSAIPEFLIRPLGASLIYLIRFRFTFFFAYLYQFIIRIWLLLNFSFQRDQFS